MPKYSVKKPFTILVAVILVLVLGFVSLTGIQTDLLPAMNLPYLMVITTYPGASPEQVEADVTKPLENALSTLNGVKNVTSQSNENYSLLFLEYQDDTDMDSAMVKASTAVNQPGRGHSTVRRSPVRGWTKESLRAWRHWPASPGTGFLAPYTVSPSRGWPMEARWTRIWWVRPVSSRHSTWV